MKEITEQDEAYRTMSADAYEVAASFIGGKELRIMRQKYEKEGRVDMCQGLRDWLDEEIIESRTKDIRNLMSNLQVTAPKAMDLLNIPKAEQARYLEKI